MTTLQASDFDYYLPDNLISQYPAKRRDESRLLVLNKKSGELAHKNFFEIVDYLQEGDLLIMNNSKVFPARLHGHKEETLGKVEVLLNHLKSNGNWEVVGKGLKVGSKIVFNGDRLEAEVVEKTSDTYEIRFDICGEDFYRIIEEIGEIPLPPYIKRKIKSQNQKAKNDTVTTIDKERYQTVYAKERGSVAAPTAGLHFTSELLNRIEGKGVGIDYVTLHVGLGTFTPVKTERISEHKMHEEYYTISENVIEKIIKTKNNGGRVIAVGTTTTRVLETIFGDYQKLKNKKIPLENKNDHLENLTEVQNVLSKKLNTENMLSGSTDIFIYPPYKFKCVDGMITNFHLPKSTLLMLVSAFSSRENIKNAYKQAVDNEYKFFSYGDAMLIV